MNGISISIIIFLVSFGMSTAIVLSFYKVHIHKGLIAHLRQAKIAFGLTVMIIVISISLMLVSPAYAQEAEMGILRTVPTFQDIIAALSMLADVIGEALVGITLGWAAKPTGIGFIIGLIMLICFRSVAPVSFEVESLTIVSRIANRNLHIMIYIVLIAGIAGAIIGALGVYGELVEFIGPAIQLGMMSGIGIILSVVSIEMIKENRTIGLVSAISAFIVYFATINDPSALIYSLAASVAISVGVARFIHFEPILPDPEREKISLILPFRQFGFLFRKYQTYEDSPAGGGQKARVIKSLTRAHWIIIVRGTLALLALRAGTSLTYPAINADLAGIEPVTGSGINIFDATNIMVGLSGIASAIFGGSPIEPIITGTAAAPNPVFSTALMMGLAAVILLVGIIGKVARYIPIQAITGFLLVLGALIIFPENAPAVMEIDPIVGGVTAVIAAATMDPFIGMVAGLFVKGLMALFVGS